MNNNINSLNLKIIECKKCSRLVEFREKIAKEKRKQYKNEIYWGRAVPGFGDVNAELLIVGLAPAAHGANRTGRIFTGDRSADFLYKCLYKAKISNNQKSENVNDNLKLNNTYITTALKCVPPNDKPKSNELKNCFYYFEKEFLILKNLKVILALGKIAFDTCVGFLKLDKKKFAFQHSEIFNIKNKLHLVACYHPSPRNVNTKRINEEKMIEVLTKVKNMLKTTP
ncbi:MAG: uracil-DNA glycosylase [Rickettsiales bacterium]|nr:uracil-DNA glycosylase [Rickettsiales bacterium]